MMEQKPPFNQTEITSSSQKPQHLNENEVIQKYLNGVSSCQIAQELQTDDYKIQYILKKNNIKCRGNKKTINHTEVVQKYLGGASSLQIAKEYGTSKTTITNILKENNIARRKAVSIDSNEIINKYTSGVSARQIAIEFETTHTRIIKILKKNKIERRKPLQIDYNEVIQKYLNGASSCQIAVEFNTTSGRVLDILKKNNIECRKAVPIDSTELINKYTSGASAKQISVELNTTSDRVLNILKKNNIERKKIRPYCINTCVVCGKTFHPEINPNRKTCSDECHRKNQRKPAKPDSMHAKKDRGEISDKEYNEYIAKNLGFKSHNDYANNCRHIKGTRRPLEEAKGTGVYLGVYIGERVLSKIFENVQRMPNNNIGYDFICKKGYKIDVKCSCLRREEGTNLWGFNISKNPIADYFLLLAFDTNDSLEPQHIWLISNTEPLPELRWISQRNTRRLNQINYLRIPDTTKHLEVFKRFEQTDKLEKLKECCNTLKVEA